LRLITRCHNAQLRLKERIRLIRNISPEHNQEFFIYNLLVMQLGLLIEFLENVVDITLFKLNVQEWLCLSLQTLWLLVYSPAN